MKLSKSCDIVAPCVFFYGLHHRLRYTGQDKVEGDCPRFVIDLSNFPSNSTSTVLADAFGTSYYATRCKSL